MGYICTKRGQKCNNEIQIWTVKADIYFKWRVLSWAWPWPPRLDDETQDNTPLRRYLLATLLRRYLLTNLFIEEIRQGGVAHQQPTSGSDSVRLVLEFLGPKLEKVLQQKATSIIRINLRYLLEVCGISIWFSLMHVTAQFLVTHDKYFLGHWTLCIHQHMLNIWF